ncbi:tRNA 5-methoxyuridine(34)/uridine 5-oxyacetic acid(34) synthase CmoB [Desulfosarcina ovata]|uniref:tRNA U34 carboxymethyltransferase n=1 Tax=Desulfosarcina ovata subsp. ovata TaxID=2752305 RepID=A0A5K8AG73_9BACT|nr:tRNA 5-methoxyuridine(34)/uridine 5-oxyacetic acid(34) synthase CmoB [Desulfosarcina ovata]BBO90874.1 tRNA U34 carboxymethyltransferase [Desulfosarcina ovata subsp. ovata]
MNRLAELSADPAMAPHLPELIRAVSAREENFFQTNKKGMALARALEKLPTVRPSSNDVDQDRIRIGTRDDLDDSQSSRLHEALTGLKPWRKGPFDVFGIPVDSEWNSAIKWNRLAAHLPSQSGKRVLDIGASCGYYMFRMASHQPALVLGIEPYATFYFQFLALSGYLSIPRVHCLPLRLEELPVIRRCFDTILCMGILYHRRSPLDTLLQIHQLMAPGGQLVLETLIIEGDGEMALFPKKRYARMNNIFFIPSVTCLSHWLARCGFADIRCVDISRTTPDEQRKTDWIDTQSLTDFLDPRDPAKTVEGYPAPVRAMVLATASPK